MTETKNPTRTELSELGEFELIKLLTKDFGIKNMVKFYWTVTQVTSHKV